MVKTCCQCRQLADAWNLGAGDEGVAKTRPPGGAKRHAQRGVCRFEIGQDGTKRGRRGYDAGKKIKGRNRHIAADSQGNLLTVVAQSAGIQDRAGARAVLTRLFCRFDTIAKVFVDGGYTGTLIEWAKRMFGYSVEVVKRTEQHLFQVLSKRWIVERTLAWLNWSRRLYKDHELLHTTAETMICVPFAHLLLRRIAQFLNRFLGMLRQLRIAPATAKRLDEKHTRLESPAGDFNVVALVFEKSCLPCNNLQVVVNATFVAGIEKVERLRCRGRGIALLTRLDLEVVQCVQIVFHLLERGERRLAICSHGRVILRTGDVGDGLPPAVIEECLGQRGPNREEPAGPGKPVEGRGAHESCHSGKR